LSTSNRIDKWLWAVRVFKTRNKAAEACRAGKVKIDGQKIKPSREIKIGEEIEIQNGILTRRVLVKAKLANRVSAKLVEEFMEDITPEEEIQKLKLLREMNYEYRERGSGRPTKKDRRAIEGLKDSGPEDDDW